MALQGIAQTGALCASVQKQDGHHLRPESNQFDIQPTSFYFCLALEVDSPGSVNPTVPMLDS